MDKKTYIQLMREHISDGSTMKWPQHDLVYLISKTANGWKFEWVRDGKCESIQETNDYVLMHFKNRGALINGMTFEEWKCEVEQSMNHMHVDVVKLL